MSEAKFTPGQWEVSDPLPGLSTHEITSPYDACWIARVQDHRDCITTPSGMANAHLIAAAPNMYAALRRLVVALGKHRTLLTTEEWAAANDALAKADNSAVGHAEAPDDGIDFGHVLAKCKDDTMNNIPIPLLILMLLTAFLLGTILARRRRK